MPARDFFISYTGADQAWAQWIAWELEAAGYSVFLQAWDIRPGQNFPREMHEALINCDRLIAVLSPAYLSNSRFGEEEWTAKYADKTDAVITVRVVDCNPGGLLRPIVYIDLAGKTEPAARHVLIDGLKPVNRRDRVAFPGEAVKPKRFPGELPGIWQVSHQRNLHFTGRANLLGDLRNSLETSGRSAITALGGMPGIGKTQLALEYTYRFASDYEVVAWIPSENPTLLSTAIGKLGTALFPQSDPSDQPKLVQAALDWLTHNSGWLLIFDNAPNAEACEPYCPKGNSGHLVITSRNPNFGALATTLEVKRLARPDAIAFVQKRSRAHDPAGANDLCQELGDLPLALSQAAAYIEENAISIRDYLDLLRTEAGELLGEVTKTFHLAFEKLQADHPPAIELLNLIAFLDPDSIPRDLLHSTAPSVFAFNERVKQLRRYSLIDVDPQRVSIHRLVQKIVWDRLDSTRQSEVLRAALKLLKVFPNPLDHKNWADCARLLPHVLAVTLFARKLDVALEAVSLVLNNAGLYQAEQGQLEQAAALLRDSLVTAENVFGPEHPEVAIRANNLALRLQDQGDLDGALTYAQQALFIDERVYGPDDPNVAIDANNIGLILRDQGDLDGALKYAKRAIIINEEVYGPDHPNVARDANNIGMILEDQGDLDGALKYAERALAIDENTLGPDHPKVAIRTNNIGHILQQQGDLDHALKYAQRALAINEKVLGPDHPNVARDANNIGRILEDQGFLDTALPWLQRAVKIFKATYGPNTPSTKIAVNNLRNLQARLNRP